MAFTAASPAFCAIPKSSAARASLNPPTTRFLAKTPLHRLGFAAAADNLLSHHVATKLRSFSTAKPVRGAATMAKKSVGDLSAAKLKGKKVFVRADPNVPLDDNQNITDDTRIRVAIPTIKHLINNGARLKSFSPVTWELGGHMTVHRAKKEKAAAAVSDDHQHNSPRAHECSLCHENFGTGLALGGHMRKQFDKSKLAGKAANSNSTSGDGESSVDGGRAKPMFDLNVLPPPE